MGLGGYSEGLGVQFFFLNSNQVWCVITYMNGTCKCKIFWVPAPWGGAKRSNIFLSQSQSPFQRFLNQTLCVISQLKDIKYIRQDFHLFAWVMPQGWDLGVPWGLGVKKIPPKFSQIWCVSYLHERHKQRHNFLGASLLGPWGGAKRSNIIKSQLQSQFQIF